ncbi:hypothetical protein KKH36_02670 [Patescibacteria group bacterium]|nr:hypothetical protein [Patescibacteria group bacterium]
MKNNKTNKEYDWQKGMDPNDIFSNIGKLMRMNISYGRDDIVGFPGTTPLNIAECVYAEYLGYHANNIGLHTTGNDKEVGFGGTQTAEEEVIAMAADLMGVTLEEVDGYISSGGTEANFMGCWIGRNSSENPQKTALLCSSLTHNSITAKTVDILMNRDRKCLKLIPTDKSGHILVEKMIEAVEVSINDFDNFVIVGNAGTTMLGSVDDIPRMSFALGELKKIYPHKKFHFHVDAAFGGFVVPFISNIPHIGFRNHHVDTITLDAHKMGLTPYGSGIILSRKGLFARTSTKAPYFPGADASFSGSRSGASALSTWAAMKYMGKDGYAKTTQRLMKVTSEIKCILHNNGFEIFKNDINIIGVKGSLPRWIQKDFRVHVQESFPENLSHPENGKIISVWNIVVMNHTKPELIEKIISQLKRKVG